MSGSLRETSVFQPAGGIWMVIVRYRFALLPCTLWSDRKPVRRWEGNNLLHFLLDGLKSS